MWGKIRDAVVGVAIWLACAGVLWGLGYALISLGGERALDPPGWNCRAVDEFNHTGKCYPEEGWHFEERNGRRVAVRDITPSQEDRDLDINTANAWKDLTNDQRREILAGRATIYTYFDFEPPPSKK